MLHRNRPTVSSGAGVLRIEIVDALDNALITDVAQYTDDYGRAPCQPARCA